MDGNSAPAFRRDDTEGRERLRMQRRELQVTFWLINRQLCAIAKLLRPDSGNVSADGASMHNDAAQAVTLTRSR
jgi:hypothetical protein